jgi:uncharacterized protein YkwD
MTFIALMRSLLALVLVGATLSLGAASAEAPRGANPTPGGPGQGQDSDQGGDGSGTRGLRVASGHGNAAGNGKGQGQGNGHAEGSDNAPRDDHGQPLEIAEGTQGTDIAAQVLALVNQERVSRGLHALVPSATLTRAAAWMAADLRQRGYLAHTDSIGRNLRQRLTAFGYSTDTYISENVGRGFATVEALVAAFMDSPGHRSNVLSDEVFALGVARAADESRGWRWYWALDFGSSATLGEFETSEPSDAASAGGPSAAVIRSDGTSIPRSLVLHPGWNLVGWFGAPTSASVLTSPSVSLFQWDSETQLYAGYRGDVPTRADDDHPIDVADGLWVFVEKHLSAHWPAPAVITSRTVPLTAGFSLVTWTGPDGTLIADAVADIAEALEAAFVWDVDAGAFRAYRPDALPFTNRAAAFN